jgi:hypothetical protein
LYLASLHMDSVAKGSMGRAHTCAQGQRQSNSILTCQEFSLTVHSVVEGGEVLDLDIESDRRLVVGELPGLRQKSTGAAAGASRPGAAAGAAPICNY